MADIKTPSSPVKASSDAPPESPTTARPLDFDDDNQETGTTAATFDTESTPLPPPKDEPPPKPARPLSQREQNENTLKEAFPTIDVAVVKAVLTASRGEVEPAFNALLGMSDPDAANIETQPAKPPRPTGQPTKMTQLEADELYARQLAEHYSSAGSQQLPPRTSSRYNEDLPGSRVGKPGTNPNPDDVPWRSFIDGEHNPRVQPSLGDRVSSHWTPLDDLPEIRDNIKKGFLETQSTVNKWLGNLKKKIDGEDDVQGFSSQPARPAQGYNQQSYGRRSGDARRSADISRYDADPEVIGDDFSKLELRDSEGPPKKPARPLANPDLFRSASGRRVSPGSSRKVSFQDGPPEEIKDKDMYGSASNTPARPTSANKSSKWQPLSTVEPSPVTDNDPFSLEDSDEEKDAKPIEMKDDDEHERVQKATADAMKDDIGDPMSIAK